MTDQQLKSTAGLGVLVWIALGLTSAAPVIAGIGFIVALVAGITLFLRQHRPTKGI